MRLETELTRRRFLVTAAGSVAAALAACTRSATDTPSTSFPQAVLPSFSPTPADCLSGVERPTTPLWELALGRGLVYGSSAATWQLSDPQWVGGQP